MRRALIAGLLLAAALATPQAAGAEARAFELVSPIDKDGGAIASPGGLFGGGLFQAAAAGGAITYSSATAFGEDAPGAPPASQYISRRSSGGWSTENISTSLQSGAYGDHPDGVPYRAFSADLARALMLNPRRCEPPEPCPRAYSLRDNAGGTFTPLPAQAAGMTVLAASPDLTRVLFEEEGGAVHEWSGGSVLVPGEAPAEPEPVGGIVGVLGASASGDVVYFQDAEGLKRWRSGTVTVVAAGADAAAPSDWPARTGTARVSADGEHLAFLSEAGLAGSDTADANTGDPTAQLYLWGPPPGGGAPQLRCASCPATGRPEGSTSIPGAQVNGSTATYKPRVLATSGSRLFFETADDLALKDTNSRSDVYEWEAQGEGGCTKAAGCQSLVSGGLGEGSTFLDASADGKDVYFTTEDSLVKSDPGSIDVYDARIGGGLPEPEPPFECVGDLCQLLPSPPDDPTPGTLRPNAGNPALKIVEEAQRRRRCPKGKRKVRRKGKVRCARAKQRRHHRRAKGQRKGARR
jgi:hypothetical protein